MDIQKLTEKAEQKIDLAAAGWPEDYVYVKLFPLKARQVIQKARTQGLNMARVLELLQASGKTATQDNIAVLLQDKEIAATVFNDQFDISYSEYKTAVLKYGLDPVRHTFKDQDKPVVIDDAFLDQLSGTAPALFEYLVVQVEKYNEGYVLGEKTGPN